MWSIIGIESFSELQESYKNHNKSQATEVGHKSKLIWYFCRQYPNSGFIIIPCTITCLFDFNRCDVQSVKMAITTYQYYCEPTCFEYYGRLHIFFWVCRKCGKPKKTAVYHAFNRGWGHVYANSHFSLMIFFFFLNVCLFLFQQLTMCSNAGHLETCGAEW